MTVLAIDPGVSGAVVLLGAHIIECRRDFKHASEIDQAIHDLAARADVAVIELVHAMPGQGVSSMFNFGEARGYAMGALGSCGFRLPGHDDPDSLVNKPLIEVTPQHWQKFYMHLGGLGVLRVEGEGTLTTKYKLDSVATCLRVLPKSEQFLKRKLDHNTADALLIALWYQLNPGAPSAVHAGRPKRKKK